MKNPFKKIEPHIVEKHLVVCDECGFLKYDLTDCATCEALHLRDSQL